MSFHSVCLEQGVIRGSLLVQMESASRDQVAVTASWSAAMAPTKKDARAWMNKKDSVSKGHTGR